MGQIRKKNIEAIQANQKHISVNTLDDKYNPVLYENNSIKVKIENNIFNLKNRYIHISPMTYLKESEDIFMEHNKASLDKLCVFFVGIGDGLYLREFLKNTTARIIFVIEPFKEIFEKTIECFDIGDILHDKRVVIYIGNDLRSSNFQALILRDIVYLRNMGLVLHPLYDLISKSTINDVIKSIQDTSIYLYKAVGNSPADTLIGMTNSINNLERILETPSIETIKNKVKGKPIVIVSAGPSLNKNIDVLKSIQDYVFIIAATTIQSKLFNYGIMPDAIAALERDEDIYDILFKDQEMSDQVILFAQSLIHSKIFDNYPGPIITCFREQSFFEKGISDVIGEINTFSAGSSVAHMNFQIAHLLEGSPVILVGQDLAYSDDGHTHSDGTVHEEKTQENDLESYSKVGSKKEFMEVEGIVKEKVTTNNIWIHFKYWFETEISKRNLKVINCTEGGARINGTIEMSLNEAVEKFNIKEHKKEKLVVEKIDIDEKMDRLRKIHTHFKKTIDDFEYINSQLDNLEKNVEKMRAFPSQTHFDKYTAQFNSIVNVKWKINNYSDLLNHIAQAFRIVSVQKELLIGQINNRTKLENWLEVQDDYILKFRKIVEMVLGIISPVYNYYEERM